MTVAAALAVLAAVLATAGVGTVLPGVGGPRERRASMRGRALRALAGAGVGLRARPPGDLAARIAAAGRPAGLGPRELMAAKLGAAVAGGALGALLGAVAPGRLGPLLVAGAPVSGFLAPDVWLSHRARERARRIRRELPDALDLLRVTVEAGSALGAALGAVGQRTSGELAREIRAAGEDMALGTPRAEALAAMAERAPLAEIRSLAGALSRAERHGAPLADTLAALSRDARLARRRRIQEAAARAGPKIQLVVALLLVPSVLLLVAAALVTALVDRGSGLGALG